MTRSLQFKISSALFLVGAVLISISAVRMTGRSVESRRERLLAEAFTEGSRLSGMAQHLIRRQAAHLIDLNISYTSTHQDLVLGLVLNDRGSVSHATRQSLRGLSLARTPLASAQELVETARTTMEGRVIETVRDRTLLAIFPFREGLDERRGCVVLEYDLQRPLAEGMAAALHASTVQGLALAGGCLALWLLLKIVITGRVSVLVGQVEGISLERDPLAGLPGNDELAHVSQAIRTAHEKLRHSELRLRQIAMAMRDVFWLAPAQPDSEPFVNDAYVEVFMRDPARLAVHRWDWLRALAREDRRRCLEVLRSLRAGGATQELELRLAGHDGQTRWVRCRGFTVPGSTTGGHAVAGIVMDVSERKMLERRLLDTAENERRRIGMDLHDDLCQRLAAALMKTGVLQAALARQESPQQALATELASDLSEATGIARRFARGLAPVGIEALGLTAALSDLGDFITSGFKVPCRVEFSNVDALLTGETATHIFRVAQELANNAAKHSRCTWLEIAFETTPTEARLVVSHDGMPYRPGESDSNGSGMGMHFVRQRLDALGASLVFHPPTSAEDGATVSVECLVPLSPPQNET